MKSLFTLHAGEYLVGSFIQENYKEKAFKVWIPAKDEGIDLLVTNESFEKSVSLQVKWSKDYKPTHTSLQKREFKACGWWTIERSKLKNSRADLWVFVLHSMTEKNQNYIIETSAKVLFYGVQRLCRWTIMPLTVFLCPLTQSMDSKIWTFAEVSNH